MLKSSELRIGTIVQAGIIVELTKDDIVVYDGYQKWRQSKGMEIEPMPLTEGLLLIRLGFKKTIGFYIEIDDDKSLELGFNNDNSTNQYYVYFRNKNKGGVDDLVLIRKDLKYVHELQNLYYSITGKEFEALIKKPLIS